MSFSQIYIISAYLTHDQILVAMGFTKIFSLTLSLHFIVASFGQSFKNSNQDSIKITEIIKCPKIAYPIKETEMSNYQICFRNILPPRQKITNKDYLDTYDKWDQQPKYKQMDKSDYDSIIYFVKTYGLLNIDLNYSKADTTQGEIIFKSGSCSQSYLIETKNDKISLSISGAYWFKLPLVLRDFDDLFQRIAEKYRIGDK